MKTLDEINVLAEKAYPIKNDVCRGLWSENFAFKLGYTQCQEDNQSEINELKYRLSEAELIISNLNKQD